MFNNTEVKKQLDMVGVYLTYLSIHSHWIRTLHVT